MRVALDTNVLVYAEGINGAAKAATANAVIDALPPADTVIPVQVMGELFRVLTRKAQWPPRRARDATAQWGSTFVVEPTARAALFAALDLAVDHRLAIFDAVILAAAAEAGCGLLLSQDMQDGFAWRGVTVVDPFADERHPLLARALGA